MVQRKESRAFLFWFLDFCETSLTIRHPILKSLILIGTKKRVFSFFWRWLFNLFTICFFLRVPRYRSYTKLLTNFNVCPCQCACVCASVLAFSFSRHVIVVFLLSHNTTFTHSSLLTDLFYIYSIFTSSTGAMCFSVSFFFFFK